mgnify:FL=1
MRKLYAILLAGLIAASMAMPVSAAEFTPSVTQKETPAVVTTGGAAGVVTNAAGEVVGQISASDLVLTPVSQTSTADPAVSARLSNAYNQIRTSSIQTIVPEVDTVLAQTAPDVDVQNLVVRDMFDVSATGAAAELMNDASTSVAVTFNVDNLSPNQFLMVLCLNADGQWEIIPEDQIIRDANGNITVALNGPATLAFVVDSTQNSQSLSSGEELIIDYNVASPQTGGSDTTDSVSVVPVAALSGAAAAGFILLARRKRSV